jgi:hypothetical protein
MFMEVLSRHGTIRDNILDCVLVEWGIFSCSWIINVRR